jgi:hypothetical protein
MSSRLVESDLHFLRILTSNEPGFNQRINDHKETIDTILDVKSKKKSFSQVNTKRKVSQGHDYDDDNSAYFLFMCPLSNSKVNYKM